MPGPVKDQHSVLSVQQRHHLGINTQGHRLQSVHRSSSSITTSTYNTGRGLQSVHTSKQILLKIPSVTFVSTFTAPARRTRLR